MLKHLSLILLAIALFASTPLFACDENIACDKCAKESEFSWNPDNRYVTARLNRFYSLDEQISVAYKANDFGKVKELAKENLELAAIYRCNWNYGNAIHDTNSLLGLTSLKSGDIDAAADYLLKAGKSSGSPQLNTFGPELDLANELLKVGKVDAVKAYLKDLKSFWEMNNGKLDAWLASIDKGEKPELSRFPKPGVLQLLLYWLTTLWPVVVSMVFLYVQRKRIPKKPLFFIVGLLSGYVAMYAGNWVVSYGIQQTLGSIEKVSDTTIFLVTYLPLGIILLLPVISLFVVARLFYPRIKGPTWR